MKKKTTDILIWLLALLPVLLVAVLYGRLPDRVPTNWGLNGEVSYSGKAFLWVTALACPVLAVLFRVLPKIDPRKKNYDRFRNYYDGFCLVMLLFLLGLNVVTLIESLRPGTVSVSRLIVVGLGLLLIFLGNMMPKVKNNFFVGIKNPWTLSDPDVWNRANRLGGLLFFAAGVALVPSGLFLPEAASLAVTMIGALTAAVVPTVMSYIWYRQKTGQTVDKDEGG